MGSAMACVESVAALGERVGPLAAAHLELTFRATLRGPGVERRERFVRVVTGAQHPFGNFAVVKDAEDAALTKRAMEALVGVEAPSSVVYLDEALSEGVRAALAAHGYALAESMPAMAVDIDALAPTALPAGYTLARIGGGSLSEMWVERLSIGYGFPRAVGELFSPRAMGAGEAADAPIQCFAVLFEGEPVCTSMLHLAEGVGGVYCVATIPEQRGKGLGAHATAEPLRLARKAGCRVGVLQSSSAGHSVYSRLGFREFGRVPLYVRLPGA